MSKRADRKRLTDGDAASVHLIVALVRPRGVDGVRRSSRARAGGDADGADDVGELSAARVLVARGEATAAVCLLRGRHVGAGDPTRHVAEARPRVGRDGDPVRGVAEAGQAQHGDGAVGAGRDLVAVDLVRRTGARTRAGVVATAHGIGTRRPGTPVVRRAVQRRTRVAGAAGRVVGGEQVRIAAAAGELDPPAGWWPAGHRHRRPRRRADVGGLRGVGTPRHAPAGPLGADADRVAVHGLQRLGAAGLFRPRPAAVGGDEEGVRAVGESVVGVGEAEVIDARSERATAAHPGYVEVDAAAHRAPRRAVAGLQQRRAPPGPADAAGGREREPAVVADERQIEDLHVLQPRRAEHRPGRGRAGRRAGRARSGARRGPAGSVRRGLPVVGADVECGDGGADPDDGEHGSRCDQRQAGPSPRGRCTAPQLVGGFAAQRVGVVVGREDPVCDVVGIGRVERVRGKAAAQRRLHRRLGGRPGVAPSAEGPAAHGAAIRSRSVASPRLIRLRTVPARAPMAAAISSSGRSSK